ncbi:Peptidase S41 [Ophiocordyceps camponoti-floridani]|uniref:Peptidase S41 n=1 Tax=Ophiocordyceps camponoti-floridani TaxID=2030778 RepID=A0A8H4Q8G0_9HYPO|nr:Peptidase S41 [Ophiocordyceps camponoti-floridani]
MHLLLPLSLLALGAGAQEPPKNEADEACALVSKAVGEPEPLSPGQENSTKPRRRILPGREAYNCLKSIPFDKDRASAFVPELKKYLGFQSTLDLLKKPPKTWPFAPVDIPKGLDALGTDFKNQYQFDLAIDQLMTNAHDAHLRMQTCSLSIFEFRRDHAGIVSVSKDGLADPEVFAATDVAHLAKGHNDKISPIKTINGEDVLSFLEKIAIDSSAQSPDAQWNELFVSPATGSKLKTGQFIGNHGDWPGGDVTTITFKNGSSVEAPTIAFADGTKRFNETTPAQVFDSYCVPKGPPPPRTLRNGTLPDIPTLPKPFARDPLNEMLGFNLDNETIVLRLPSFGSAEKAQDYSVLIHNLTNSIFRKAKKSGRTKMIIDVSSNSGGHIARYLDLFGALFPDLVPDENRRLRRSEQVTALIQAFSVFNETESRNQNFTFAHKTLTRPDLTTGFPTVQDFIGNAVLEGQPMTAPFNFISLLESNFTPISGFGERTFDKTKRPKRPFRVDDMVILGNGICHSSCATFVHLMTTQGGVKTIVFGGRHQPGPMDIIGGVRGGEVAPLHGLSAMMDNAKNILLNSTNTVPLSQSDREKAANSLPKPLQNLTLALGGAVNLHSMYTTEGDDGLTLQFLKSPANCRRFYTGRNIADPKTVWKDAKEAAWGNGKCLDQVTEEEKTEEAKAP